MEQRGKRKEEHRAGQVKLKEKEKGRGESTARKREEKRQAERVVVRRSAFTTQGTFFLTQPSSSALAQKRKEVATPSASQAREEQEAAGNGRGRGKGASARGCERVRASPARGSSCLPRSNKGRNRVKLALKNDRRIGAEEVGWRWR